MEGAYHGHEGLRRWWDAFPGSFPDYTLVVEEVRDLGDTTLAHARGRGHVAGSATPLIDSFWEAAEVARPQMRLVAQLFDRGRRPRSRRAVGVSQ